MAYPIPNPGDSLGQLSFRLYYGEVLRQALQQARDGVLHPQWRENVGSSSRLSGLQHSDPYGVRLSVVTAINEMPRAAWEPGHSPDWRAALNSWFDASRAALAEHRKTVLDQHATMTQSSMTARVRLTAPTAGDALTKITELDVQNDGLARQSLATFITQRDTLTASYGAGLSAGGEDVDWRTWLEGRIDTWDTDNSLAAEGARAMVRQQPSYLERLPTYW